MSPADVGRFADLLACVVCGGQVGLDRQSLECERGHRFDIARHGYVTMLSGSGARFRSDTPRMLAARSRVLASALYRPLVLSVADAVRVACGARSAPHIADIGTGTGEYLAAALNTMLAGGTRPRGVGVDLAKEAARMVSRRHAAVGVVADVWSPLPLRTGVFDTVMSIFAPRHPAEFHRLLSSSGAMVVVIPTSKHLREISGPMGMLTVGAEKAERLDERLAPWFVRHNDDRLEYTVTVDRQVVVDIAAMGPAAFHTDEQRLAERADSLQDFVPVTISVILAVYRPVVSTDE